MMPFTVDQFFAVFARYNQEVWPAQALLIVLALLAGYVGLGRRRAGGWIPAGVLGLLWVWMGAVYQMGYFAEINPAADLFGVVFLIQGALFGLVAVRGSLTFRPAGDAYGTLGALIMLYALVGYPLLGTMAGHTYPAAPTFGAPCPTTIFTFGLLLWTLGKVPGWLLMIPVLWALVGISAVVNFGMAEDLGLPIAGVLVTLLLLLRNRGVRVSERAPEAAPSVSS